MKRNEDDASMNTEPTKYTHPPCEICGRPATVGITDSTEDLSGTVWVMHKPHSGHYFCDEHKRVPRVYPAEKGKPLYSEQQD